MAERGLMDQLGGGFYRYSVDERWAILHFEKMLYDNGPAGGGPLSARGQADAHTQPCGAVTTLSSLREPADRTGRLPGPPIVVLRGPKAKLTDWQRRLQPVCRDAALCLAIPADVTGLPDILDKPVRTYVSACLYWR